MSEMKVLPIQGKCFGARVENVNVRSLDEKELESIKAAFLKFGFLVFFIKGVGKQIIIISTSEIKFISFVTLNFFLYLINSLLDIFFI